MKYLENLNLESLSEELSSTELGGGLKLAGRIEVYSTKKSGEEKKSSKILESKILSSKEEATSAMTAEDKKVRRILIDLIQTLNASQVYHDFSDLSFDAFHEIPVNVAIQKINSHLAEVTLQKHDFINHLWKEINATLDGQLHKSKVCLFPSFICCLLSLFLYVIFSVLL
jgi:hypothetical protein